MPAEQQKTDAQILAQLRRRSDPATAADLGLPARGGAARLRNIPGVIEVGTRPTGKAGRPPALFTVRERVPSPASDQEPRGEGDVPAGQDPASLSRTGELSEQDAQERDAA